MEVLKKKKKKYLHYLQYIQIHNPALQAINMGVLKQTNKKTQSAFAFLNYFWALSITAE